MHNIFSNLLCFTIYFAHLGASSNNFNDNSQNRNLEKWNHKLTPSFKLAFGESNYCKVGSVSKIHIRCK